MKLIHCRKCGASIVTDEGLIERMSDAIHELNEKARNEKNPRISHSYICEAASVTKMMKGIIHNTTQMEDRKITCSAEMGELVHYLLENDLITTEKLDEIRKEARRKANIKNKENQKEIERIYGKFESLYVPSNKTKPDPTANKAIKRVKKEN